MHWSKETLFCPGLDFKAFFDKRDQNLLYIENVGLRSQVSCRKIEASTSFQNHFITQIQQFPLEIIVYNILLKEKKYDFFL